MLTSAAFGQKTMAFRNLSQDTGPQISIGKLWLIKNFVFQKKKLLKTCDYILECLFTFAIDLIMLECVLLAGGMWLKQDPHNDNMK